MEQNLIRALKTQWGTHLSTHPQPFWVPLVAILDFADGAVLQAVRRCR